MKIVYMKPEVEVITLSHREQLLADSYRVVDGGPTNTGGGGSNLPGTVGETDGETDPFDGHGQGSGGSGTRAKSWNAWDTWD
jgi:hypothetical protein